MKSIQEQIKEHEDAIVKLRQQDKKTFIFNGVEYETKITQKGKKLSDIIIPKGWRLWTLEEFKALENADKLKEINFEPDGKWEGFFIKQPYRWNEKKGLVSVVIRDWGSGLDLYCNWGPSVVLVGLGVRFCRDIK